MKRSGPALSVQNLSKRFGDRVAFEDVTFEIGYGEVFGFLGPNGAGKTTTVRALSTLISPTSGSATVTGIPLAPENGERIRQSISVMPESPGLYLTRLRLGPSSSVAELVGWRRRAWGVMVAHDGQVAVEVRHGNAADHHERHPGRACEPGRGLPGPPRRTVTAATAGDQPILEEDGMRYGVLGTWMVGRALASA